MPSLGSLLRLFCLLLFLCLGAAAAEQPPVEQDDGKKKEEKKEKPFKYSAWCAFRDLSVVTIPSKENPETDETREIARKWQGFGRRGHWASIVLELKNTTKIEDEFVYKGSASIELNPLGENSQGIVPYQTTYTQSFEVGAQAQKQYHFSVLCPEVGWSNEPIRIDITANGRLYDSRLIQLQDLFGHDFVVVVSETSGAFRYLKPLKPRDDELTLPEQNQERQREVAAIEAAELPSRWHDLTLADLIILDGPPREMLTDAQWDALTSYVKAGGQLLIMAGKDPSRVKNKRLEELAGIRVGEMVEISSLDGIHPPLGTPQPDWKLPIVDAKVAADVKGVTETWKNRLGYLEMCRRWYGAGAVTFLPFSLSDQALPRTWTGKTEIPLALLKAGRNRQVFARASQELEQDEDTQAQQLVEVYNGRARPQIVSDNIASIRNVLAKSFSEDTPVQLQARPTVSSFLALYLLCVAPFNYLLFGWFRRREVAWLAVPAWAAAFCIIAYVIGYMGQTGKLTVNEVSVIEVGSDQNVGMARTFLGLYAPKRDEYALQFPAHKGADGVEFDVQAAPAHLVNTEQQSARNIEVARLALLDSDAGLSVNGLRVQERSTRHLEVMHRVGLGGGIDLRVKPRAGERNVFDVDVTNNTPYELHNPVLFFEGRAIELASIDPTSKTQALLPVGASYSLASLNSTNLKDGDEAFLGKQPSFVTGKVHRSNRVGAIHQYVRHRLTKYKGAVMCAWIENRADMPALPVKVGRAGREPEAPGNFDGLSLLVVGVPIKDSTSRIDLDKRYAIRFSHDYDIQAGTGTWQALKNKSAPLQALGAGHVVYLELAVPENYRQLEQNRLQLQLAGKLGVATSSTVRTGRANVPGPEQQYNGTLDVEWQRSGAPRKHWEAIDAASLMFNIKPAEPMELSKKLVLPLDDPSLRVGDVFRLRIQAKLPEGSVPMQLQGVELKLEKKQ